MNYTLTKPCNQCPFLNSMRHGFTLKRLDQFSKGEFACHKTCEENVGVFEAKDSSVHCAGALIYLEKRERPHQMMRICERIGLYDRTKLDPASFELVR